MLYVIWLFVKRLSQEAIQRRSQRDRLVKIKVNDTEQMHSNFPYIDVGELMVPALPSSDHAGYINPNIEVPSAF